MNTLAAYITALGPPECIEVGQLPVPAPGPTDVLVRTEALAVDQVDTLVLSGAYRTPTPFPFIIGRDLAGTVAASGPGAIGFAEGDQVWCNSLGHGGRQGSFVQHVVVAGAPAGEQPQAGGLAAVLMFARLAASSVSIAAKGSGTGAEGRRGDEHLAIVVDDVIDDQADQAGVLRYSDDHRIVRELGELPPPDRAATHPVQWPGRARYPRVSTRDPARWPLTWPGPGSGPPNRGR